MKFKRIFLITLLLLAVLTLCSVSATEDNATNEVVNIENIQNTNESASNVNLSDESFEITPDENDGVLGLNEESDQTTLSNGGGNMLASQDNCVVGDSETHSMKITIKPAKVYSNKKFSYSAKLTDNCNPVSGVLLSLSIYDGLDACASYSARTNSNGVATFKLEPELVGKYDIDVEVDVYDAHYNGGYTYAYSYIKVIKNPKAKTTVKAPKVIAKYKQNKYFKITVKNYKGKPIKKLRLTLDIRTGKKWKTYHVKTNSKGVAKFNVKKLKPGVHNVIIYIEDADTKYDLEKESKIIIKAKKTTKKTTTKKKSYPKPINGKYGNKNTITVKVKDGAKTIKIKCKYKKNLQQYLGHKYKNGKRYDVNVVYEKRNGMQQGKKGWWTIGTNGGLSDNAKVGSSYNKYHPIAKVTLH